MGGKATHSSVAVGVLWHESDSWFYWSVGMV